MRLYALSLLFLFLDPLGNITTGHSAAESPPNTWGILVALQPEVDPISVFGSGHIPFRSYAELPYTPISKRDNYYFVPPTDYLEDWYHSLKIHPGVRFVQWNRPIESRQSVPDDPYWEEQWNLHRIGLPEVWAFNNDLTYARTERKTIWVGVLEKLGFDLYHKDLSNQFWVNPDETPNDHIDNDHNGYVDDLKGWNFQSETSMHQADAHGTKVAGLVAGHSHNHIGIAGFTNQAGIIPLSGLHYEHQIVRAYLYLRDLRAKYNQSQGQEGALVVATNASFGVNHGQPDNYPIWCEVFDKLGEVGILSVCSVINAPADIDQTGDIPTSCSSDFLITVTESDFNDQLPSDTGYGYHTVDLAAPGRGSFTTFSNHRYGHVTRGTSFASPQVSGTIALLYANLCQNQNKDAINDPREFALRIKTWIIAGAEKLPTFQNKVKANGRLSALGSYQLMRQQCMTTTVPKKAIGRQVFPNPFSSAITTTIHVTTTGPFSFELFNNQGQKIWTHHQILLAGQSVRTTLQMPNLDPGMYQLIINGDNHQTVHRLLKMTNG